MITLVNKCKEGRTYRIDANFYVNKRSLTYKGNPITPESSAEAYATPVDLKIVKDVPFQVPVELADFFVNLLPMNKNDQPFFKCVEVGSAEEAFLDGVVNDENNSEYDYNYIPPWVYIPAEE